VWGLCPIAGVGAIAVVCPGTAREIALAHPMFGLCVLYAGSQLRGPAATVVTVLAVAADTAVLAVVEAPRAAAVAAVFVAAVLGATAVLLVQVMNRMARLGLALQRQAGLDSLTVWSAGGGSTRRSPRHWRRLVARRLGCRHALILLDVDTFKSINDVHGHPSATTRWCTWPGLLRTHVRSGDPVLARLGGDELPCCCAAALRRMAAARASSSSRLSAPHRCTCPTHLARAVDQRGRRPCAAARQRPARPLCRR
jgi:diguanylate cyclase (GGDEF)-like protein